MNKLSLLAVSVLGLLFASCKSISYVPQPEANPMFTERGQISAQAGLTHRYAQGMAAWSPVRHFALSGTVSKAYPSYGNIWAIGGRIQYYRPFRPGGDLYYHLSAGIDHGHANRKWTSGVMLDFLYQYDNWMKVRYNGYSLASGVYWRYDEQTILGFDLDVTNIVYSRFQTDKIAVPGDSLTYRPDSRYNANGTRPYRPVAIGVISLKHSSVNKKFISRLNIGFRLPVKEYVLLMNQTSGSAEYGKWSYQSVETPYLLLSLQLGFELQHIFKKKHLASKPIF